MQRNQEICLLKMTKTKSRRDLNQKNKRRTKIIAQRHIYNRSS